MEVRQPNNGLRELRVSEGIQEGGDHMNIDILIALFVGIYIGTNFGFIIAGLMGASKHADMLD